VLESEEDQEKEQQESPFLNDSFPGKISSEKAIDQNEEIDSAVWFEPDSSKEGRVN